MFRIKHFAATVVVWLALCQTAACGETAKAVPGPKDKCPVCGMFVAKYPDWLASVTYRGGVTLFFDGPKDMFSYVLEPARYTSERRRRDIIALVVKEYYSLKRIDARGAYYVIGSDVLGPMGHELIPFATRKDAASFMADHKGKIVVRFDDVTLQLIASLR